MAQQDGQVENIDSAIVVDVRRGVGGAPGAEQDREVEDINLTIIVEVADFACG